MVFLMSDGPGHRFLTKLEKALRKQRRADNTGRVPHGRSFQSHAVFSLGRRYRRYGKDGRRVVEESLPALCGNRPLTPFGQGRRDASLGSGLINCQKGKKFLLSA